VAVIRPIGGSLDNQQRLDQQARSLGEQQRELGLHTQQLTTQLRSHQGQRRKDRWHQRRARQPPTQRIANLDNYSAVSSTTVYFKNGRSDHRPEVQNASCRSSPRKPRVSRATVIQIEGYASDVGSAPLNQRLSSLRADAVAALLQQSGIRRQKC
jgi:outer membrane protein OmpA-like peptidoglycan-associated protein